MAIWGRPAGFALTRAAIKVAHTVTRTNIRAFAWAAEQTLVTLVLVNAAIGPTPAVVAPYLHFTEFLIADTVRPTFTVA
jgi:hypothetical protein